MINILSPELPPQDEKKIGASIATATEAPGKEKTTVYYIQGVAPTITFSPFIS
jgi:hypothetical protein